MICFQQASAGRQSQSMSQPAQPHRTAQPYLPGDMLGSHPFSRPSYASSAMMAAAALDQQATAASQHRLNSSHHHSTSMPSLGSRARPQQYSGGHPGSHAASSLPPGLSQQEAMSVIYGMEMAAASAGAANNWVPGRRMTENVTPAAHAAAQQQQQQHRSLGGMNPGVHYMPYDNF